MKRGQSALEYVFLIGIAAATIIVASAYISRGFQGRLRAQADQLGEQYSPKNMKTDIRQNSTVDFDDKLIIDNAAKENTTISKATTTTTTAEGSHEKVRGLKYEH